MDIYNFAFVKTADTAALENAITLINRSRHQPVNYTRIIQTTARRGWIALIIDSVVPDHYLLRNLSGRLHTDTFELGMNNITLYYRLHSSGRTTAAFESHLSLWVTQQLRAILSSGNVMRIDLAEPVGRVILQRYHEHRRSRAWAQPNASPKLPPAIEQYYAGKASDLANLFETGTDLKYIQDIMKPGFSAMDALERLVSALALPYFKGDPVIVEEDDTTTNELGAVIKNRRVVRNLATLQPSSWPMNSKLPEGWVILTQERWTEEATHQG